MDEDLTYRMVLGMVKSPLDMPALEETGDLSAKIFGFRDHIKKSPDSFTNGSATSGEINSPYLLLERKTFS